MHGGIATDLPVRGVPVRLEASLGPTNGNVRGCHGDVLRQSSRGFGFPIPLANAHNVQRMKQLIERFSQGKVEHPSAQPVKAQQEGGRCPGS